MRTPIPTFKSSTAATHALVGLWSVALTTFILATLYFARDLLIPLTLAALLTFLLAPPVTRLEQWLGRIGAVLFIVALIFTGLGVTGWVLPINSSISPPNCLTTRRTSKQSCAPSKCRWPAGSPSFPRRSRS